jgi:hypothetical protein
MPDSFLSAGILLARSHFRCSTGGPSDVVDIFFTSNQSWTSTTLSQPRISLAAASLGEMVLFAGGISSLYGFFCSRSYRFLQLFFYNPVYVYAYIEDYGDYLSLLFFLGSSTAYPSSS